MSHVKASGQVYISSGLRSARLPILAQRYAPTTHTTFSITSRNPGWPQQGKISINDELLTGRKISYLQSQAYRRRQTSRKIEQQNSRLYKRINSQKSLYSQDSMKKSSVSIRSVSRCSSRESTGKEQISKRHLRKTQPKPARIHLEQHNVEKLQKEHINQFKGTFNENSNRHGKTNPAPKTSQSFYKRMEVKGPKAIPIGNLLHRIAQQISQPQPRHGDKRQKTRK